MMVGNEEQDCGTVLFILLAIVGTLSSSSSTGGYLSIHCRQFLGGARTSS